jgi:very-short-patch-repair endonuclease
MRSISEAAKEYRISNRGSVGDKFKTDMGIKHPNIGLDFVEYEDRLIKVILTCPDHGNYMARPYVAKSSPTAGCSKCESVRKAKVRIDQKDSINEKTRQTSMARYGVDWPMKSKDIQEKISNTCIEKYGVERTIYTDECRKITKESILSRPLVSLTEDQLNEYNDNSFMQSLSKSGMTMQDIAERYGITSYVVLNRFLTNGLIPHRHPISKIEKDISQFLNDNGIYHTTCDRKVLGKQELDIYIPDKGIAIEINGTYWHSDAQKSEDYHINKTELAELSGVQIIHINEQEIENHIDKVKSMVLAKLGIFKHRLYARICIIKEVSRSDSVKFLDECHMQGSGSIGSIRYGLYHQGDLVSLMTFGKPRFSDKYDWELIRFCSKLNHSVVGGASKLISQFRKTRAGSIISYANRRWSVGSLYENLGFILSHKSEPSYEWVGINRTYSRYQTQKHLLSKLLGDKFNPGESESVNMSNAGFHRMFDCGNLVYVLV